MIRYNDNVIRIAAAYLAWFQRLHELACLPNLDEIFICCIAQQVHIYQCWPWWYCNLNNIFGTLRKCNFMYYFMDGYVLQKVNHICWLLLKIIKCQMKKNKKWPFHVVFWSLFWVEEQRLREHVLTLFCIFRRRASPDAASRDVINMGTEDG